MPVILSQRVNGHHPTLEPASPPLRPPGVIALSLWTLWAALAAWLSLGTIGFASSHGARIGLLPASWGALALVIGAAAVVGWLLRTGAPTAPLALLALVALPWLPFQVPAAFLIWSGPGAALVWIAAGALLLHGLWRAWVFGVTFISALAPVRAGLAALLIFGAAAWRTAPSVPGGDEPHYLVITQSLLRDGDLKIENNHRRGDYRSFYAADLPPHFQRKGRDGEIYSVHAPGLSVLVLPAFAIAGYPGVVVFLLVVAAAGSALAWWVAWLSTGQASAAWFAWAAVTLPVTAVFHSFTVYPDGPGGILALTGAWALLRADGERRNLSARVAPWFWHGAALAMLPWLHSRFAVIAGGFGALVLLRLSATANPAAKAVAFLSAPAISALLWLGYFIAIYGRPDPSAPYGPGEMGSAVWIPGGLGGLLFDQRFGLLPYAPVLACAFAGLAVMIWRPGTRRLALELLFVMTPYLLTVTHFAMWWGGWSAPARFFVPVLPLLAVPAAVFWVTVERRRERIVATAALFLTAFATVILVWVDRGRLAFNVRDTPALWLEWLSTAADLPQALPWWTRGADAPFFRDIGIWIAAIGLAVVATRLTIPRVLQRTRTAPYVVLAWALAAAAMGAATVVWALRGADGRSVVAAQLGLLRTIASVPRALVFDLEHLQRIDLPAVPRRLRIELTRPLTSGRGFGRDDRPLFDVPQVPAGEYLVTPVTERAQGWLMIGVSRDQFNLRTAPLAPPPQPIDLRFPVTVRGIVVRGDEEARQGLRGLVIEPRGVMPPGDWNGILARRAARYGPATVFFVDDRSFPEPEAFWVGGARSSSFVVQPDDGRPTVELLLRNGPVANHMAVEAAGAPTELDFAPGEERRVSVPIDASRGAALVSARVTAGFRPSEHDPASRDSRFLGIWIRVNP